MSIKFLLLLNFKKFEYQILQGPIKGSKENGCFMTLKIVLSTYVGGAISLGGRKMALFIIEMDGKKHFSFYFTFWNHYLGSRYTEKKV